MGHEDSDDQSVESYSKDSIYFAKRRLSNIEKTSTRQRQPKGLINNLSMNLIDDSDSIDNPELNDDELDFSQCDSISSMSSYANDSVEVRRRQSYRSQSKRESLDTMDSNKGIIHAGNDVEEDSDSLGYHSNPEDSFLNTQLEVIYDSVDLQKYSIAGRRLRNQMLSVKRRYSNTAQQPLESRRYQMAYNTAA